MQQMTKPIPVVSQKQQLPSRRAFLRAGALGLAVLAVGGVILTPRKSDAMRSFGRDSTPKEVAANGGAPVGKMPLSDKTLLLGFLGIVFGAAAYGMAAYFVERAKEDRERKSRSFELFR